MAPLILVVDDERAVRHFTVVVLTRAGYATVEAVDGEDALRLLRTRNGAVALVLTDIQMPNLDGLALADVIKAEFPKLRIVFMSAYSSQVIPEDRFFLSKPFTPSTLLKVVRLALASGDKDANVDTMEELKAEVERTKARSHNCGTADRIASEVFRDCGPGSPDGHTALTRSSAADAEARQEHARSIAELCRFMIDGSVPARLQGPAKPDAKGDKERRS